jgi:Flp pilus assembly protein TadG
MLNDLHRQALALMNLLNHTAPSSQSSLRARSMRERICARCRLGEEGSNLVEFALIVPVLIGLLTGIFSFGLAMMNYQALVNGTATAAQYISMARGVTSDPCADTWNTMVGAAQTLKTGTGQLSMSLKFGSSSPHALGVGTHCASATSEMVQGQTVTVTASYPCGIQVYGITVASSCNLTSTLSEYEN